MTKILFTASDHAVQLEILCIFYHKCFRIIVVHELKDSALHNNNDLIIQRDNFGIVALAMVTMN